MQSQTVEEVEDPSHGCEDMSEGDESDHSEEEEERQKAAGFTLDLGSAPGGDSKFRDDNFYLGYDRGDNRYAEEGFAVGGRGEDMVLDMAGDENVSSSSPPHVLLLTCAVQKTSDMNPLCKADVALFKALYTTLFTAGKGCRSAHLHGSTNGLMLHSGRPGYTFTQLFNDLHGIFCFVMLHGVLKNTAATCTRMTPIQSLNDILCLFFSSAACRCHKARTPDLLVPCWQHI